MSGSRKHEYAVRRSLSRGPSVHHIGIGKLVERLDKLIRTATSDNCSVT